MTTNHKADDGVHRLIDMVVEEVSLVDRAANKHRFLIVKRDGTMDDDDNDNGQQTEANEPQQVEPADRPGENTALGAALSALESLTGLVELLGSLGADQSDARLAELAQELRSVAEQLLSGTAEQDDEDIEARAKTKSGLSKPVDESTFASHITAAKVAIARLAELTNRQLSSKAGKPAGGASPKHAPPPEGDSLAKLTEAFRAISETVKQQQHRLGRVEKQFGLPNSTSHAERVSKTTTQDVGWPLDLNKPMDRESVDKAVSFHDL